MVTKTLVVCIDGGKLDRVARSGLSAIVNKLYHTTHVPLMGLQSVFPSSTAPAHASFFSGAEPREHGVLGNWWAGGHRAEGESVYDPVETFHPYTRGSTSGASLLDDIEGQSLTWCAVHMPQTYSPTDERSQPAIYALYAPPSVTVLRGDGSGAFVATVHFHSQPVEVSYDTRQAVVHFAGRSGETVDVISAEQQWFVLQLDGCVAGFYAKVQWVGEDPLLQISHTGLVVGLHRFDPDFQVEVMKRDLVDEAARFSDCLPLYREVPTEAWVTRVSLLMNSRYDPHVLFVRYNQADHAQELLIGLVDDTAVGIYADQNIDSVYSKIARQVEVLHDEIRPVDQIVVFSDHGIAPLQMLLPVRWIISTIWPEGAPNVVYADSCLVCLRFDSGLKTVPEGAHEWVRGIGVEVIEADSEWFDRYVGSQPLDVLLVCENGSEFDMHSDAVAPLSVQSAAHGGDPRLPDLYGMVLIAGNKLLDRSPEDPKSITSLRKILVEMLVSESDERCDQLTREV